MAKYQYRRNGNVKISSNQLIMKSHCGYQCNISQLWRNNVAASMAMWERNQQRLCEKCGNGYVRNGVMARKHMWRKRREI